MSGRRSAPFLPLRVSLQFLRQIRRNMRDDQSIVPLVSEFEDVTNPMDLRDQRAFVRRNPKPRAQSPRAECALERLHEVVYSFSGARGNRHASKKSLEVRIDDFSVRQIIDFVENDQRLLAISVEFFDPSIDRVDLLVDTRVT